MRSCRRRRSLPQQIEEALATLNERGINVVETEETEADEEEETVASSADQPSTLPPKTSGGM